MGIIILIIERLRYVLENNIDWIQSIDIGSSSSLAHTASRNVASFGDHHALVLAAWYHRDSLGAWLCWLLRLGHHTAQARYSRRPRESARASSMLCSQRRPRPCLLLNLLLLDDHGTMNGSTTRIVNFSGSICLGVVAQCRASMPGIVRFASILLHSQLCIACLLISELAHSLV